MAQQPYLTLSDLTELKRELNSLGYLFDQINAEQYMVINLRKLKNKKPIKLSQAELDILNKEDSNSLSAQLEQQNKTESDDSNNKTLKKNDALFDLWNMLIEQVKTCAPSITYAALATQLNLPGKNTHLTVQKQLKFIHQFCAKQHIPDLALLVSSEQTGIPSKRFLVKEVRENDTGVILDWVRERLQSVFVHDYTADGNTFLAEITEPDTTTVSGND